MQSETKVTLLHRLRDGTDSLAWGEFSHRYWRLIFAIAKRRGCSDHTAEEIVQDVMLEVFRERNVFTYDPSRGRFRDCARPRVERADRPAERFEADGNILGAAKYSWKRLERIGQREQGRR